MEHLGLALSNYVYHNLKLFRGVTYMGVPCAAPRVPKIVPEVRTPRNLTEALAVLSKSTYLLFTACLPPLSSRVFCDNTAFSHGDRSRSVHVSEFRAELMPGLVL
jgi:hypothetical protein